MGTRLHEGENLACFRWVLFSFDTAVFRRKHYTVTTVQVCSSAPPTKPHVNSRLASGGLRFFQLADLIFSSVSTSTSSTCTKCFLSLVLYVVTVGLFFKLVIVSPIQVMSFELLEGALGCLLCLGDRIADTSGALSCFNLLGHAWRYFGMLVVSYLISWQNEL